MTTLNARAALYIALLLGALAAHHDSHALDCDANGFCKDPVLTPADAEMPWQYVGLMPADLPPGASCPSGGGGWLVQNVFPTLSDETPRELQRYCLYTAVNPSDPQPVMPPVQNLQQLDRNVMAVAAMSGIPPLKAQVGGGLHQQFLSQAGRAAVAPASAAPEIRLAILDTIPTSNNALLEPVPTSAHGYALAHMAEDLACNGNQTNCAIRVTSSLALPFECADGSAQCINTTDGGFMGTPITLAAAVYNEVEIWRLSGENGLIINLSLGWDPVFNDTISGDTRVATQAARVALQYAQCYGAIIIGAAGNTLAGPVRPDGPLMPGDLNRTRALDETACEALVEEDLPMALFPPAGIRVPLIHAVGAVDSAGKKLLGRIDGEPLLVAYGDHGIATDRTPVFTKTLTGSSTSALVASATAAALWSYSDDMPGWRIMRSLYRAAAPVPGAGAPRQADFCAGDPAVCGDVHRVSLCHTIETECIGSRCPTKAALDCASLAPSQPVIDLDAIAQTFPAVPDIDFNQAGFSTQTFIECAQTPGDDYQLRYFGPAPANPCPQLQYYGTQATPYAGGQPGENNCEDCPMGVRSPGTVYFEINAQFDAREAVLFCSLAPTTTIAYSLAQLGTLVPGERYVVAGIDEQCALAGIVLAAIVNDGNPALDAAVVTVPLIINTDPDLDGIPAHLDNCSLVANSDQRDTDGDGLGNLCDTDLTNNCVTNVEDLGVLRSVFFSGDEDADFDGDGVVNVVDLGYLRNFFFMPPGPSGTQNDCD